MVSGKVNYIRSHAKDNVGIVIQEEGEVPFGQKIALQNISTGTAIIRYGHTIGFAKEDLEYHSWVKGDKIATPLPPSLDLSQYKKTQTPQLSELSGFSFQGFRNPDGSVGTKNILAIATTVHCVSGLAKHVVREVKQRLLPKFPHVDDVVAIDHTYGCGVAIDAPGAIIPIRTLQNILTHPNFGGEVLLLGLGCEKLRPEMLLTQDSNAFASTFYMQDSANLGFGQMVENALVKAENHLIILNRRRRETCPVSDLVIGVQCGGSDALSGITANPLVGVVADLVVRAGGSVLFSEVTEVRDAAHLLLNRCADREVANQFISQLNWYDNYLLAGQADTNANPSPGNKRGGLSNVTEKALGSIVKSGTTPVRDVVGPGEKVRCKGLTFAATPASDFVCGTLQLAAGMQVHIFTTGRGTPYGLSTVPVIKVGSNSILSKRWFDLIDMDAGQILAGDKSIEELGRELFELVLDIASGRKEVACDKLGLHNDLVLFNPGPLT